jgi:anti-sigma B factor antagonist
MSGLLVETLVERDVVVVVVSGEVDVANADRIVQVGSAALNEQSTTSLVVDLARVTFMDSTGLSALVTLRNTSHALAKELVLRSPTDPVGKVLALTGLDKVFAIEPPLPGPDRLADAG